MFVKQSPILSAMYQPIREEGTQLMSGHPHLFLFPSLLFNDTLSISEILKSLYTPYCVTSPQNICQSLASLLSKERGSDGQMDTYRATLSNGQSGMLTRAPDFRCPHHMGTSIMCLKIFFNYFKISE